MNCVVQRHLGTPLLAGSTCSLYGSEGCRVVSFVCALGIGGSFGGCGAIQGLQWAIFGYLSSGYDPGSKETNYG